MTARLSRYGRPRRLLLVGMLICVVCASAAAADSPKGALEALYLAELSFELPPGDIVIGEMNSVTLSVLSPADSVPTLTTSAGEVSAMRRVSKGKFSARLTLPKTKFPRYAIVAATDADKRFAWIAVPLKARASVEVDSEPQANVSVRLREAEFGPVVADQRGRAQVDILVPPGLSHAVSVATDSLGNASHKRIALGVPPSSRLLLLCPEDAEHVLVFFANGAGGGEAQPQFELRSEEVSAAQPRRIAPGAFIVPFAVPEGVEAGTEARFVVQADGSVAKCRLRVPLEEPTQLELTADTGFVVADGPTEVLLEAVWSFPGLRATRRIDPKITVSLGTTQVETLSNREQRVRWSLPKYFNGESQATITIAYDGANSLSAEKSVELNPGKLSKITLSIDEERLLANGKSSAQLTAVATDSSGNRALLKEPKLSLSGTLSPLIRSDEGAYNATYTTMESYEVNVDRISLSDKSGVTANLVVPLMPRQRSFWVLARLGYIHNFGQVSAPMGAVGVGARLPLGDENFVVGLEGGVFRSQTDINIDAPTDVAIVVTGVPILARLAYELALGQVIPGLRVYPGLSGGMMWVGSTATGASLDQVASSAVPIYGGLVGAELPWGPGRPSLELGFFTSSLDLGWLHGDATGFQATLGYSITP